MITSLRIKNQARVEVNSKGKMCVHGNELSAKDIPAVRYVVEPEKLNNADDVVNWVRYHNSKLDMAVHIIELPLIGKRTHEWVNYFREVLPDVAIYVYAGIGDNEVANGIGEDLKESIGVLCNCKIDRLIIVDNSTTLYQVTAERLKKEVASLANVKVSEVGICNSPLMNGENCCLSALQCRILEARYGKRDDMVVPSANHEGKNCSNCGCIRYLLVETDMKAPEVKVSVGNKVAKATHEKEVEEQEITVKVKKKAGVKTVKPFGFKK